MVSPIHSSLKSRRRNRLPCHLRANSSRPRFVGTSHLVRALVRRSIENPAEPAPGRTVRDQTQARGYRARKRHVTRLTAAPAVLEAAA